MCMSNISNCLKCYSFDKKKSSLAVPEVVKLTLKWIWNYLTKFSSLTARKISVQAARGTSLPRQQGSWGQHGAHLGPVVPRWAPCWPHEPCYLGSYRPSPVQLHLTISLPTSEMGGTYKHEPHGHLNIQPEEIGIKLMVASG